MQQLSSNLITFPLQQLSSNLITFQNINKIIERLIHSCLMTFLNANDILYERQFGFRHNHSTPHMLFQQLPVRENPHLGYMYLNKDKLPNKAIYTSPNKIMYIA